MPSTKDASSRVSPRAMQTHSPCASTSTATVSRRVSSHVYARSPFFSARDADAADADADADAYADADVGSNVAS